MIVLVLLLLFVAAPVEATIIYVDKDNACNGAGTTGNPYCSITLAVAAVAAGDTIRIRDAASAYSETINTTKTGTNDGARITVEPDIGHNPTIQNAGNSGSCATFWLHGSYWTIQGLNFDSTGVQPCIYGAILVHADTASNQSVKILNNTFKGWGGNASTETTGMSAVLISGGALDAASGFWPTNTLIEGNVFDSNRRSALTLLHTDGTIIRSNEFKNATCGRGDDTAVNELGIFAIYHNKNMLITQNTFHDFTPWSSCTTLANQLFSTEAAFWCDVDSDQTGNVIERNRIYNIDQGKTNTSNPNGNSHSSRGLFIEAVCGGYTVKNNLIHDIGNNGIVYSHHSLAGPRVQILNNTVVSAGNNGISIKQGYVNIVNNILSLNGNEQLCIGNGCEDGTTVDTDVTSNYNLYNDGATQANIVRRGGTLYDLAGWQKACTCDANSIAADPKFLKDK